MARIAPTPDTLDLTVETLIIGAGACGLVAAIAAHETSAMVMVVEGDAVPAGSTALSAGLIPAAGTHLQKAAGIEDTPAQFAADIQAKAHGENDQYLVDVLAHGAGPAIDWLTEDHGLPFTVVTDFDYPGHARRRMHGLPGRSGAELVNALRARAEALGIPIICERRADTLFHGNGRVTGAALRLPDGSTETVGCDRLILACNGFGGNRAMVTRHMPEIDGAVWFGHDGNRGDAVLWGDDLGAATRHLGAYQGHGNVAHPHGILITWAVITSGGIQVNNRGERFWDESQGYSEAARRVMAQPDGIAFAIFDARIAAIARQFEDFRNAEAQGAIKSADTIAGLAQALGLPPRTLEATVDALPLGGTDGFGRSFGDIPLAPPFRGVRVTGALFHTQGGLIVDRHARVLDTSGAPIAGLYAGGGAACGVSGASDSGYLSGNGLLSAIVLGRIAGSEAGL